MKGIVSERMLRRLRYSLIARMLRFPKPYFQRTSQGELVAMITGETEPMGGMMGDALTQPVLQAGQMLTILFFLFLQSIWFGLAAVALIPLQAWLIPKLQRQINLMNKARIKEVRQLAAVIGETAAGAADLRTHGGWRHRLALVTDQLGTIFSIRLDIYQKKFFMKFINNFITQLTPFFFFSVGGYLVIQGAVSLGALVAALAAYKDLSSPWKELLAYYNQAQDMSLRWETVVSKFSPSGVIDEKLLTKKPADPPSLKGTMSLNGICLTDDDGNSVLENITVDIPQGSVVAIAAPSEEDRVALADVMTREVMPTSGQVSIAGLALSGLAQATISTHIGHANSKPVLFRGTFGENVMMPVGRAPEQFLTQAENGPLAEAIRAGNSPDPLTPAWLDPSRAGVSSDVELRAWWMTLIQAIGSDGPMFRKSLDQIIDPSVDHNLQKGLVAIRPLVWERIVQAQLEKHVWRFDPDHYNPALPVASNLLFATLKRPKSQGEITPQDDLFVLLRRLGLEDGLLAISQEMIELLGQIFGTDGTEHPLFRRLGLDPALFEKCMDIFESKKARSNKNLSDAERAVLMTLPAQITAEQMGPAFTQDMKKRIVAQRFEHQDRLKAALNDIYAPLDESSVAEGVSVLENALFGKISDSAGGRADDLRQIVSEVLEQAGLKPAVIDLLYDLPLGLNGTNLPAIFAEPLALMRATIKRPDVLIMDQVLNSYDQSSRTKVHKNLRKLLPDTTMIYLADSFEKPDLFDVYVEVYQGRMVAAETADQSIDETATSTDLQRKVRALETTDLFSGLDRRQLRLLAFGAKWFHAEAGDVIFNKDDDPKDGAYMLLSGTAELFKPQEEKVSPIATVGPGTLVGELGLIRNVPRALSMRAVTDIEALRLGADEFLAVVENDAETSFKLLQVVAGYTS